MLDLKCDAWFKHTHARKLNFAADETKGFALKRMPQKFQLTLIEELTFLFNIMSNGNDVLLALSMRNNLISALLLSGELDQGKSTWVRKIWKQRKHYANLIQEMRLRVTMKCFLIIIQWYLPCLTNCCV